MPNEYEIEIVEVNVIDGGIEVFARAWKNGVQLGFGSDGTIDIERFRIFNPPVLVDDSLGEVVRTWTNEITREVNTRTLREDPEEALIQSLLHTVKQVCKDGSSIIPNSRGNTTSTFYSDASGDGFVTRGPNTQTTWSSARDTLDGEQGITNSTVQYIMADKETATNWTVRRCFFPFDTSSIPDGDTINSATISLYQASVSEGVRSIGIVQTSQASTSALAVGDFDTCGSLNSATEGATRKTCTAVQYQDFALNATGLTWVSKTGYTKLGARLSGDLDNTAPSARDYVLIAFADETGTANDPKLVVVHSASASTFIPRISFIM